MEHLFLLYAKAGEEIGAYIWTYGGLPCLQCTLMDVFASPFFMHLEMIQMVMSWLVSDGHQCIQYVSPVNF
jgi:hypothetical protein